MLQTAPEASRSLSYTGSGALGPRRLCPSGAPGERGRRIAQTERSGSASLRSAGTDRRERSGGHGQRKSRCPEEDDSQVGSPGAGGAAPPPAAPLSLKRCRRRGRGGRGWPGTSAPVPPPARARPAPRPAAPSLPRSRCPSRPRRRSVRSVPQRGAPPAAAEPLSRRRRPCPPSLRLPAGLPSASRPPPPGCRPAPAPSWGRGCDAPAGLTPLARCPGRRSPGQERCGSRAGCVCPAGTARLPCHSTEMGDRATPARQGEFLPTGCSHGSNNSRGSQEAASALRHSFTSFHFAHDPSQPRTAAGKGQPQE